MIQKRIYVAGHRGMVGGAVVRRLQKMGVSQILTTDRTTVDLCRQNDVEAFFAAQRPEIVVFAAAKVGGIHANNTYPAQFIYDNLAMASNTIHAAYQSGVERFLFLGSTCIYPRMAPQPIQENSLLTSPLEETNEAYALAKIAGLKMCQFYRRQYGVLFHSAMPTNLYGPGDNYHPQDSHVLPALLRRFHEAKTQKLPIVSVWGSGKPRREFLHVDDLAAAIVHLLQIDNPPDWVNVGTGVDISIADLAHLVAEVVGYQGQIAFDTSKPDGTPVKRTDIGLIQQTGWSPQIDFRSGLQNTYANFLSGHVRGLETKLQLV
ncbi:MAG: GDP-L-fucose synthase [Pirellulaceae bacterium]|nr:GDP-L-fucose synthase [Pirellulaceae bacterium]